MQDAGCFKMRAGVLELIAGIALNGVEGASGIGIRFDHPEDRGRRKALSKGVRAEAEGEKVLFELEVNMEYGRDFRAVGRRIQEEVRDAVESMTGWQVEAVNVDVVGVNAL